MPSRDPRTAPTPSAFALSDVPEDLVRKDDRGDEEAKDPADRINLEYIEGRMKRSVARQVIKLIHDNPELAAAVVRGWMRGER